MQLFLNKQQQQKKTNMFVVFSRPACVWRLVLCVHRYNILSSPFGSWGYCKHPWLEAGVRLVGFQSDVCSSQLLVPSLHFSCYLPSCMFKEEANKSMHENLEKIFFFFVCLNAPKCVWPAQHWLISIYQSTDLFIVQSATGNKLTILTQDANST